MTTKELRELQDKLKSEGWLRPEEMADKEKQSKTWIYLQARLGKIETKKVPITKELIYVRKKS